jgi:hypothetical protein
LQYISYPTVAMWPALLGAEDVAGPAQLQVAHGDLEPGPEVAVLLDRLEPLGRDRRHRAVGRQQQVAVRPVLPPADPAAELVQLAQPEPVGVVDDDRVRVRDVQARLDDGGRDEDVRLVADELHHRLLHLPLAHLPVADHDPGVGDHLLHVVGELQNVAHPVVDEVDLPLPLQLAEQGQLHPVAVERHHLGHHAAAVLRGRRQAADVAEPEHRHVQRPRDRRGRHGQHVDRLAHLLQPLLWVTPNRCSSSTTTSPRSANLMSLLSRRWVPISTSTSPLAVRVSVSLSCLPVLNRLTDSIWNGVVGHPLLERPVVLLGQHGGRDEDGHLLAELGRLERGPHGQLGLAVPDVAAQQPVHRPRLLHVGLDLLVPDDLVGRRLVRELGLELPLPLGVRRERLPDLGRPGGLHVEQVGGHVHDRLGDLRLLLLPPAAAELGEGRVAGEAADVLLDQVDLAGRDVQGRVVGEPERQVLLALAVLGDRLHADELGDPVGDVDDVVAGLEVEERVGPAGTRSPS